MRLQQSLKRKGTAIFSLSWLASWRSATSCLQISIRALSPWLRHLARRVWLSPRLSGHLSGMEVREKTREEKEKQAILKICGISAFHLSSTCGPDSTMPRGEEFQKTRDYSEEKSVGKPEGESVSFQFFSSLPAVKLSTSKHFTGMTVLLYNKIKNARKNTVQYNKSKSKPMQIK